ncbi:MAG TPA: type 4a pilus biogenesis protein PilO [Candidatus Aquilonibacter sp.]|nr:type 4a pilus biogenesis protein PilO [Candidatus Aquilonibacter sp.]
MPDLRQTRKKIKIALAAMLGVDIVAVAVLFSPLVGSTASRRQELNQLWAELQAKTREVKPLTNLDQKVKMANQQIAEFYQKRFPAQDSDIAAEFGKLAAQNGVTIDEARYKVSDDAEQHLLPVEMEANLSGNYVSLAKFINALERDDMVFIINDLTLGGEQNGPIKLQMKLDTYLRAGA